MLPEILTLVAAVLANDLDDLAYSGREFDDRIVLLSSSE